MNHVEYAINTIGWREVRQQLIDLAKRKEENLKNFGMFEQAKTWEKILKKFSTLPKNPQL